MNWRRDAHFKGCFELVEGGNEIARVGPPSAGIDAAGSSKGPWIAVWLDGFDSVANARVAAMAAIKAALAVRKPSRAEKADKKAAADLRRHVEGR